MKLSTKSRYGVRAMIDIALHGETGESQLKDISRRQAISAKYLDHILSALRKSGLIRSTRSRTTGYTLARPAQQITLREIIQILEGSLALVECVDNPQCCKQLPVCFSRDVWGKLKTEMEKVLDSITLQDLIESHKDKQQTSLHYCI
jgi:Rrf2 family cysteine metabolism transcriptional repressor